MATREDLVARRETLKLDLERALQRIASGDRSKQYDLPVKERALARLDEEIAALDLIDRPPAPRQIRMSSSRGY